MYPINSFRFILVDENPIVRKGLKSLISQEYPESIIDDADNSFVARHLLRKNKYDLIVLGVNCMNENVADTVLQLKAYDTGQKMLVLSTNSNETCAQKFLSLGVKGYLSNKSSERDIRKAISQIFQDQIYLSESFLFGA